MCTPGRERDNSFVSVQRQLSICTCIIMYVHVHGVNLEGKVINSHLHVHVHRRTALLFQRKQRLLTADVVQEDSQTHLKLPGSQCTDLRPAVGGKLGLVSLHKIHLPIQSLFSLRSLALSHCITYMYIVCMYMYMYMYSCRYNFSGISNTAFFTAYTCT